MNKNLELIRNNLNVDITTGMSPVGNWFHYQFADAEEGEVSLRLLSRPEMGNPAQMVHGGILTALSDEAMGIALFTLDLPHYYVTVNISIDFLYGIPVGSTILARGKVIRTGKKIAYVTCEIYDENERLCAVANSNLVTTSVESPKEYAK